MVRVKYIFGHGKPCSHYIPRHRTIKHNRSKITKRLTYIDILGNWGLLGVRFNDIYIGKVITEHTYFALYTALRKLLDYEETGLSPEEVERLKEKAGEGNG